MRLDHVAHTCRDPHATHRFYHDLLGLNLVQAYGGRELMLLYELPGGGSLAFITADHVPVDTDEASWERRHIGLGVNTREEFDSWLQRLQASGIKYRLVDNERIYFADPDGLVLEIEVSAPMAPNPAACDVLAHWRK